MGIFDILFGDPDDVDDGRNFVQKKYGLYDDVKESPNKGKDMYCTRCQTISRGGVKCRTCGNWLVEW